MKKMLIILVVVSLALALAGCRKTNDNECQTVWAEVSYSALSDVQSRAASFTTYQAYVDAFEGAVAGVIYRTMNSVWPDDSNGAYLRDCLNEGWRPITTGE
jgi:hypothetical protein